MPFNQNPVFRKVIVPWYDSEAACAVMIVLMTLVLIFGLVGVYVAQGSPEYRAHLWLPIIVAMLSAGVVISTVVRMVRRR